MGEAIIVRTDDGGKIASTYVSYQAFCANVNANSLDAAFGKNQGAQFLGLGMAMAMYSKFKNAGINIDTEFPNIIKCETLEDLISSDVAKDEMDINMTGLILNSPYAKDYFYTLIEVQSSQTLNLGEHAGKKADLCLIGGGASGQDTTANGKGGGSGYLEYFTGITLPQTIQFTIGAGGHYLTGNLNGGATTAIVNGTTYSAQGGTGQNGGSAGGGANEDGGSNGSSTSAGTGDGKDKHVFGAILVCGGGGGGGSYSGKGGAGGGGDGGRGATGADATEIGAGGGGSGTSVTRGGGGYRGGAFILIHEW